MGRRDKEDQLRGVRVVVFDFDGTLAVLNIDFTSMRERVFDLMRSYGVDESLIEERYVLEIIDEVVEILNRRDVSAAQAFHREAHLILHEIELQAAEQGGLLPGVKDTLRWLRQRGFKIGIVTRNCEEAVRRILPNIEDFCDVFVSRDTIRRVKPHPEHLTTVLAALDASESEAMMVGDHLLDIQAGKRMGMKTVGVLTGKTKREEFEKAEADWILESAAEIHSLFGGEDRNGSDGVWHPLMSQWSKDEGGER